MIDSSGYFVGWVGSVVGVFVSGFGPWFSVKVFGGVGVEVLLGGVGTEGPSIVGVFVV